MPRFILIDRECGGILGDTQFGLSDKPLPNDPKLTPIKAARWLQDRGATDQYPYNYRKVARDDPAATFDAYRAAPDYPKCANAEAVERDCTYVASLARILPKCAICKKPMSMDHYCIEREWAYGFAVHRYGMNGPFCCQHCFETVAKPAQEAEREERERHERESEQRRRARRERNPQGN